MGQELAEELYDAGPELSDLDIDPDDGNDSEDTGSRRTWDPHTGMKPSRRDGCASDDEVDLEDKLPYGAKKEVNVEMINLMWDLDNEDPNDKDWLPQGIQK